jgi:transcriptional regulator with XRE-family HTH domain
MKMIPERFGILLGANIRAVRTMRRMTQRDLAQLLGVNKSAVSQYENGYRVPNVHRLSIIANVFDVTIDSLVPAGDWYTVEDENQTSIFDIVEE